MEYQIGNSYTILPTKYGLWLTKDKIFDFDLLWFRTILRTSRYARKPSIGSCVMISKNVFHW